MANAADLKNAQSAEVHMVAAKSAPHRKELELNQAENFARLIHDPVLRMNIQAKIKNAR